MMVSQGKDYLTAELRREKEKGKVTE